MQINSPLKRKKNAYIICVRMKIILVNSREVTQARVTNIRVLQLHDAQFSISIIRKLLGPPSQARLLHQSCGVIHAFRSNLLITAVFLQYCKYKIVNYIGIEYVYFTFVLYNPQQILMLYICTSHLPPPSLSERRKSPEQNMFKGPKTNVDGSLTIFQLFVSRILKLIDRHLIRCFNRSCSPYSKPRTSSGKNK